MKKVLAISTALALLTAPAFAGGSHDGGHGESHEEVHHGNSDHGHGEPGHHDLKVGKPGDASTNARIINVSMKETDDGEMLFEPASFDIKQGETIRFKVVNNGELEHEFVLDDHKALMKHKALMEKFPEMEHDDPNSVRLEPGESGEILWQFTNNGEFEFACLIPGHYESGMKGGLKVAGADGHTDHSH